MRIDFFTDNPDENVGSYRIWIKDVSRTLNEIGCSSKIFQGGKQISDNTSDAIILGKSCYKLVPEIKRIFKNSKIGAINIPCDHYNPDIDFVIVGSPEEYTSMSRYKNVFIYPLIERKFENIEIKNHSNSDTMKFCFHGHWPHLAKFVPNLSVALDRYNDEVMKSELHIITGETDEYNTHPMLPKNVKIISHNYKEVDFTSVVKSCDIGIVPNVTDLSLHVPGLKDSEVSAYGLYKTDYNIRFKNKTNAGRAYVFYQHGIPVIHDLSPSSFDFMGRSGEYVCGHDSDSYLREMIRLTSPDTRDRISKINKKIFERDFNAVNHSKRLVEFINNEVINE